jgi:hypothetical protein
MSRLFLFTIKTPESEAISSPNKSFLDFLEIHGGLMQQTRESWLNAKSSKKDINMAYLNHSNYAL